MTYFDIFRILSIIRFSTISFRYYSITIYCMVFQRLIRKLGEHNKYNLTWKLSKCQNVKCTQNTWLLMQCLSLLKHTRNRYGKLKKWLSLFIKNYLKPLERGTNDIQKKSIQNMFSQCLWPCFEISLKKFTILLHNPSNI